MCLVISCLSLLVQKYIFLIIPPNVATIFKNFRTQITHPCLRFTTLWTTKL